MRILAVHNYYRQNGGENIVFDQEQKILRDRGHDVITFTRNSVETDQYSFWQRGKFFPDALFSWRTYVQARRLAQKHKPDVAILQNVFPLISPSVYYALASARVPIVQLVYNYRLVCPNAHLYTQGQVCERCVSGNFAHAVRWKCYRQSRILSAHYAMILALHRALGTFQRLVDAFIVPDQTLKDKLVLGGFLPAKIHINTNPFDLSDMQPSFSSGKYLLYVGRFEPQKGVLTLLKAMARIHPSIELLLVGMGPLSEEISYYVADLGLSNIRLLGERWGASARELIQGAMAVVVPSEWYDNTPLIIYQAFAAGKPVIASRIGGITDLISDGQNGLLFETGNVDDLACKIERIFGNSELRRGLAQRARQYVEANVGLDAHYDRVKSILEGAIRVKQNESNGAKDVRR